MPQSLLFLEECLRAEFRSKLIQFHCFIQKHLPYPIALEGFSGPGSALNL